VVDLTVAATSFSLFTLMTAIDLGALYVLHLDGGSVVIVVPCDSAGSKSSSAILKMLILHLIHSTEV
jgi:hypothetical protein